MRRRRTTALFSTTILMVVVACLWYFFAPTALGGSDTYVVTEGVSMQPRFHSGDLAIVRAEPSYHVGEIVAYYSSLLHTVVLHRIIAVNGDLYTFKGDNNDFIDPVQPTRSELRGALWIHIPGAGAPFRSLGSPLAVGLLVGIGVLFLFGVGTGVQRRRRGRGRRAGGEQAPRGPPPGAPAGSFARALAGGILVASIVVLLPAVVLAILAYTHPVRISHPYSIAYQQDGRISYYAYPPHGPAYPNGRVSTGDPIFTRVIGAVTVRFGYRFRSPAAHSVAGTLSLDADVASSDGWNQTIRLAPPVKFHGDSAELVAPLDVRAILATIATLEQQTGVTGNYTLELAPRATVHGSLGAEPLRTSLSPTAATGTVMVPLTASFAPTLGFSVNTLEVQPQTPGTTSAGALTGGQLPATLTSPITTGSVSSTTTSAGYLSFGLFSVRTSDARWIALLAIAVVMVLLMLALITARPRSNDEAAEIVARYGRWMIPVARVWQEPGVAVIDVNDMEALVRIAERYDRAILHEHDEFEGDAFWVTDESGQYRYAVATPRPAGAGTELVYEAAGAPADSYDLDTEEYRD